MNTNIDSILSNEISTVCSQDTAKNILSLAVVCAQMMLILYCSSPIVVVHTQGNAESILPLSYHRCLYTKC